MNKDYCVFILTHGRPDNIITYKTLKRCGYTGRIYFVLDNEDATIDKYIGNFGKENIVVFDKKSMADKIDEGNNFDNRKVIVHARNACFDIARKLGYKYFIELDDDYTSFDYRIDTNSILNRGSIKPFKSADIIFKEIFQFYKNANFTTLALSQGGDFIGGINNGKSSYRFNKRKCMNSFFCSIDREFRFIGSLNEDVNAYTILGSRGQLFFTIPFTSLTQKSTQNNPGGMTEEYLLSGTYVKSFHTVLMHPSSVKIAMLQSSNPRLHHTIKWINTVPMILREECRQSTVPAS